jgi:hypothetical protein
MIPAFRRLKSEDQECEDRGDREGLWNKYDGSFQIYINTDGKARWF